MAGRINDDDVKAVRDAVPIDAVVSEYLQLRNAGGGNLKGLCPFHDEKSPSFQVSPSKGLFHCFGCQEGGDTIAFVRKIDHLSFSEAVERLAATAGITLRYEEGGYNPSHQRGERIRLVEAHKAAAQFYSEQLGSPEAEIGRNFLAERGFDQAAAAHFGVGYSPAGWDHLTRYLRGKGFSDKELLTSGLAQESRRNPIDRFRGRLMWPIRDVSGEVVGFGARKLRDDDNGPKYLNTPETPIYKKSQVLYGIDLAKKDIAKSSRAVVVEGYTDVMACHLAGVTTAIATCGTAFGGDHIKILRRLLMDNGSARVIFTFDGDAAGQKAALRAFEDDQKFAAETYIAIAPDNMDPCDLRLAKGDEAVAELVQPRTPLFEFAHPPDREPLRPGDAGGPGRGPGRGGPHRRPHQERRLPARGRRPTRGHPRHPGHPVRGQARRPARPLGPRPRRQGPRARARAAARPYESAAPGPVRGPGPRAEPAQPRPPHRTRAAQAGAPVPAPGLPGVRRLWRRTSSPPRPTRRCASASRKRAAPPTPRRTICRPSWTARPTTWSAPWSPSSPSRPSTPAPSTRRTRASSWWPSAAAPSTAASWTSRARLARLGQHGDPAQLAAVQNELWVLQQYGQALRNKGAAAL